MLPNVALSQHLLSLTGKRKADSEPDDEDRRQVDTSMHRACSSVPNNKTVSPRLPVYGKYQLPRASVCEDGWTALLFDESSEGNGAFAEQVSMFGVFDGHSGDACSKHCVRSLHKHLQHLLCSSLHQAGATLDDVVDEALVQAFQQTDADMRDMPMVSNSGSTATVALVTSRSIHIAWAGMCREIPAWCSKFPSGYCAELLRAVDWAICGQPTKCCGIRCGLRLGRQQQMTHHSATCFVSQATLELWFWAAGKHWRRQ